jgi:hypothetical protein
MAAKPWIASDLRKLVDTGMREDGDGLARL